MADERFDNLSRRKPDGQEVSRKRPYSIGQWKKDAQFKRMKAIFGEDIKGGLEKLGQLLPAEAARQLEELGITVSSRTIYRWLKQEHLPLLFGHRKARFNQTDAQMVEEGRREGLERNLTPKQLFVLGKHFPSPGKGIKPRSFEEIAQEMAELENKQLTAPAIFNLKKSALTKLRRLLARRRNEQQAVLESQRAKVKKVVEAAAKMGQINLIISQLPNTAVLNIVEDWRGNGTYFVRIINRSTIILEAMEDYPEQPFEIPIEEKTIDLEEVGKNLAAYIFDYYPTAGGLPINIYQSKQAFRENRPLVQVRYLENLVTVKVNLEESSDKWQSEE